jgi:hypothetical protein
MILKAIIFGDSKFGNKNQTQSSRSFFFSRSMVFENFDAVIFGRWYESTNWNFRNNS